MSKEFDLGRVAARGALHLIIGKITSRVVGMLGGLMLIRLLTSLEYGVFNIVLVFPGILALFSDVGINTATTKYVAEYKSRGETSNLKSFFIAGLSFRIALSLILAVLCYVTADIFTLGIGKPNLASLVRLASSFIVVWMLYGFSESVLVGLDATKKYTILMIFYELLMALFPVMLVISGIGVFGALFGMLIAYTVAGITGVLASFLMIIRMAGGSSGSLGLRVALKKMLIYGIPLAAGSIIMAGRTNFYGLMIATYSNPADIGNYGAADKINSVILYFTVPISTVLLPMFSKINPIEKPATLRKIYYYSVKYSTFLILPVVALLIVLARPLTTFLFGAEYENAWIYLALLAINWVSYGLGNAQMLKLLIAQGETKLIFKLEALTAAIGVGLSLFLIPNYGIFGRIVTGLIAGWPSYAVAVKKVRDKYEFTPILRDVWRLYISILLAVALVIPIVSIPLNEILKVTVVSVIAVIIYLVATSITGAIKENDINALREIIKPQPIIGRVADKVLNIMKGLAKLRT